MKQALTIICLVAVIAGAAGIYTVFFATHPAILSWRVQQGIRAEDAIRKLSDGGDKALPALKKAAKSEDAALRLEAVKGIAKINPQRGADALCEALADEDAQVRRQAVEGLARCSGNEAVEGLVTAMRDREAGIRAVAVRAFEGKESINLDPEAYSKLLSGLRNALRDRDKSVRVGALRSLYSLDELDVKTLPVLAECLEKYNPTEDRCWAAKAIARIGDAEAMAVEPLEKCLTDKTPELRIEAASALTLYGDKGKKAAPSLVKALEQYEDTASREAMLSALLAVGPGQAEAMPPLVKLLETARDKEQKNVRIYAINYLGTLQANAAGAIPSLIQSLECMDSNEAEAASAALTSIGQPAIVPLIQYLAQNDRGEFQQALEALKQMDSDCKKSVVQHLDPQERKYIYDILKRNPGCSESKLDMLAALGPEQDYVIPELMGYLKEYAAPGDTQVRAAAVLGSYGPCAKSAIPILTECLRDRNSDLVLASLKALRQIGLDNVPMTQTQELMKQIRVLATKDDEEFIRQAAIEARDYFLRQAKASKTNLEPAGTATN